MEAKKEPTHFSSLDPKTMKIGELRAELDVRNLNAKGLRSQLIARLNKALAAESEAEKTKELEQIAPSGNDELVKEENGSLKRNLPSSPHILVHPSRTAKGGKFDCAVVSLSVLLDYRLDDSKESTFEVSLFSELFNEMLMRDFGLKIYQTLRIEERKRDRKEKRAEDETSKKTPGSILLQQSMLLAFSYFDLTHSNYFAEKDLEDLLMTLGLQISRAQVRKLVHKVSTKDGFRYRKVIDQLVEGDEEKPNLSCFVDYLRSEQDTGAKSTSDNGLVNINGCLVDVDQVLQQLRRLEKSRSVCDRKMLSTEIQLDEVRSQLKTAETTIDILRSELEQEKSRCVSLQELSAQIQNEARGYVKALQEIHQTAASVLPKAGQDCGSINHSENGTTQPEASVDNNDIVD